VTRIRQPNCRIGSGDRGKFTILDAINLCLGARRNAPVGDTDFSGLDVTRAIVIAVTCMGISFAGSMQAPV
jgi:putative ATP-dependent endonuclease of OLD family